MLLPPAFQDKTEFLPLGKAAPWKVDTEPLQFDIADCRQRMAAVLENYNAEMAKAHERLAGSALSLLRPTERTLEWPKLDEA